MKFQAVVYLSTLGKGMSYLKGVFFLIFSFFLGLHPLEASSVKERLKEIQREALEKDIPVLIAFLGSGWCPWSMKMENELFSDGALLQKLEDKCFFLQIDMPDKSDHGRIPGQGVSYLCSSFKSGKMDSPGRLSSPVRGRSNKSLDSVF